MNLTNEESKNIVFPLSLFLCPTKEADFPTLALPNGETYHSRHGAMQESSHVFIRHGLQYVCQHNNFSPLYVFELGLGTGLNLINTMANHHFSAPIVYHAIEKFPLPYAIAEQLGYFSSHAFLQRQYKKLHQLPWEEEVELHHHFLVKKICADIIDWTPENTYHLVYYDAFSFHTQPELWSRELLGKMYKWMERRGVLVTYASKGLIRRNLQDVGFVVEKLPGPQGKREMIRAIKP